MDQDAKYFMNTRGRSELYAPTTVYPYSYFGNATGYHHQRKIFVNFTDEIFWCFWYDGKNTIVNRSTDWGRTWEQGAPVFTTPFVGNCSIWYNWSTGDIYIVGDDNLPDTSIIIRKGKIQTTKIAWSSEYKVTVCAPENDLANKIPYVTCDVNGYIWLGTNMVDVLGNYNFIVNRSSMRESVTNWAQGQNMSEFGGVSPQITGMVLPLNNGEVYAIWYNGADGKIKGRKYSPPTWLPEDNINLTSPGVTAKAPSAVAEGSDIYMIFSDSIGNIIYRHYNGTEWVDEDTVNLDTSYNNLYPTITYDAPYANGKYGVTDHLHALWIRGYQIYYRRGYGPYPYGPSAYWAPAIEVGTGTVMKFNLTSAYYRLVDLPIIWVEGSSLPKSVMFQLIPEFPNIIIPIGVITIVIGIINYIIRRKLR
jgi:hypothetical protein